MSADKLSADRQGCESAGRVLSVFIGIHLWLFVFFSCYSLNSHAISQLSIKVERIEHAQGDIRNLTLKLDLQKQTPSLQTSAALKPKSQSEWLQFKLNCQSTLVNSAGNAADCAQGLLESSSFKLPFSLNISQQSLAGTPQIKASLKLDHGSFSDAAGLHAAEGLQSVLNMDVKRSVVGWDWKANVDWSAGEVFWQPLYIQADSQRLLASGVLTDDQLQLQHVQLTLPDIGELAASALIDVPTLRMRTVNAEISRLNLAKAYPLLLKPFFQKTAFGNLDVEGLAAMKMTLHDGEPDSFALALENVNLADRAQKFALYGLNAKIPWSYQAATQASLSYQSGELLRLPLGQTNVLLNLDRYSMTAPAIKLPLLDGALNLADVSAAYKDGHWYWHLSAQLEPVSMQDFTAALNLPGMSGKAYAEIPLVTYAAGSLVADGSMGLHIFNGTATVTGLTMQNALGIAPRLNADIALRNLDLGVLTSTFSFGAIEGKLDGDINHLELQNWKPVYFDARLQSSLGKYPKKISQRAVENISALGGGGAAAAIQRSFLRFFKQFNYGKMGLSCRLRNDVCEMDGIESTPHGYVIVKGSGIPAITVMGYNQTVGWSELLARIKRVTDSNSKAVVK